MEDKIDLIDKKANGLTEQVKAKLKAGNKLEAKNILTKKKRFVEQLNNMKTLSI
jgi:hypothetical protein